MKVILERVLILTFMMPLIYLVVMPVFLLRFGDFDKTLNDMNEITAELWARI